MRVRNMYNMQECIVETIQKDDKGELLLKVSMNDISETFTMPEFSESFIPSFCVTVYKY